MYDPYNGMNIGEFRAAQRAAAIEKHNARRQIEEAQRERIRLEREAARKPPHEEMQDLTADLKSRVKAIQPGDLRATAELRACFLKFLDVAAYILEVTAPRVDASPKADGEDKISKRLDISTAR